MRGYAVKVQDMWDTMIVRQSWQKELADAIKIVKENMPRYLEVARFFNLPSDENTQKLADIIAAIHMRESYFNFETHLANGDPLDADTVRVPAKIMRPLPPPYNWEEAAIAAIEHHATGWVFNMRTYKWDVPNALWFVNAYNGFGYPKEINTPYLWQGTQFYTKGQFESDGRFNPQKVDNNLGTAPLLKELWK